MEIQHVTWQTKLLKTGYFILILSAVIFGTWTRIGPQLSRDYWVDEVWRIHEISSTQAYANIEEPIQIGEFYITKTLWEIFGEQEVTSRLLPCVAGILTLILLAWYAWKHYSACVAVLITTIAAISPGLVEHSYEFKPYSLEAMLCMLSLIVFTKRKARSRIQLPLQLLFLSLLVPLAFNIIPFLCFLFIFALYSSLKESRSTFNKVAGVSIIAGLTFASVRYIYFMSPISEAHGMWSFWKPYYLQNLEQVQFFVFDRLPDLIYWYVLPVQGVAELPGLLILLLVLLVASISFLVTMAERNSFFVWLFFPSLAMLILAVFGKYPFGTRVSTFYYPILILALGYFVNQVYEFMSVRPKTLAPFLQLTILLSACWLAFQWTPRDNPGANRHNQVSKELFRFMDKHANSADSLCISHHGRMLLDYYGMNKKFETSACELPAPRNPNKEELKAFLEKREILNGSRHWFLAVHRDRGYPVLKEALTEMGANIKQDLRRSYSFLLLVDSSESARAENDLN